MRKLTTVKHCVQAGQVQVVEDDVLNIVRKVKDISSRLTVYWNDYLGKFTITETSLDGAEERLVFHTDKLDERVVDRLLRADQWQGREDPAHVLPDDDDFLSQIEEWEDEEQKAELKRAVEKGVSAGEAIGSYLELDGRGTRAQILVPRGYKQRG